MQRYYGHDATAIFNGLCYNAFMAGGHGTITKGRMNFRLHSGRIIRACWSASGSGMLLAVFAGRAQ